MLGRSNSGHIGNANWSAKTNPVNTAPEMMVAADNLLEEYKALRGEIDRNSQIMSNVFLANIAATGALIGYGLDKHRAEIFLAPFAFLIPSMFFITSQMQSTRRIASYIRVFLEPALGLQWENRWMALRARKLLPIRRKYAASLSALYTLLCSVCLLLAIESWETPWHWLPVAVVPIVLMAFLGVRSVYNGFSHDLAKDFDEAWTRLQQIETDESGPSGRNEEPSDAPTSNETT